MAELTPSPAATEAGALFARFVELIARLRAPGGCPWDREQTHESVKPMTIEEAYEVAHAIDEQDDAELAGELGDLGPASAAPAPEGRSGGRDGGGRRGGGDRDRGRRRVP